MTLMNPNLSGSHDNVRYEPCVPPVQIMLELLQYLANTGSLPPFYSTPGVKSEGQDGLSEVTIDAMEWMKEDPHYV